MAIVRRATAPNGAKVERRKSPRFQVAVPMEASWRGADGKAVKEPALARQVNANGGMLEMTVYPELGSRITLTNFLSAETAEARVLATPSSREGVSQGIIVELVVPSDSFWGVNLQVKKAGVELQKLEKSLQSEGIDLRLLREYRDAVDCVRAAAQAVQQLRERQLNGREEDDVISSLAADRIRRATNVCLEVITDVDAGRVSCETKGVAELLSATEQAAIRLKTVLLRLAPDPYISSR
jgi:hypothetical protein